MSTNSRKVQSRVVSPRSADAWGDRCRASWVASLGTLLALAANAVASPPGLGPTDRLPGTGAAERRAIVEAAATAAWDVISAMPAGIDAVAFVGVSFNAEADDSIADLVQRAIIEAAGRRSLKVVERSDPALKTLTGEWDFVDGKSDLIPPALLPDLQRVIPAGAVVWGSVTATLDDSGVIAKAEVLLKAGDVATIQVVTGTGSASVPIEAQTLILWLMRHWWFWAAVGGLVVLLGVLLVFYGLIGGPLKRGLAYASKPKVVDRSR